MGLYWISLVSTGVPADARAYWQAANTASPYGLVPGQTGAYVYSPVFLYLVRPLTAFGAAPFYALWRLIELAATAAMAGPLLPLVMLVNGVPNELNAANIQVLLALVIVVGFRYPAAWSFVLLTKVTPGIGLLWFAVRREWRSLGVALAATALVSAPFFVLAPGLWIGWFGVLAESARGPSPHGLIDVPLLVRLPVAAVIIAWGARGDHRWTVPIASMLALPVVWITSLSMLVAVLALARPIRPLAGPTSALGSGDAGQRPIALPAALQGAQR